MDISKDNEAFLLSKILGALDGEKYGADFLCRYWIKSGKLKYLPVLLGEGFDFESDEIQYVLTVEGLCERLVLALKAFLRAPYCSNSDIESEIDPIAYQKSSELLVETEKLQEISLRYGWKSLTESFTTVVYKIESLIDRLISMNTTGKKVRFFSNVKAEDFLNANQIDFQNVNDKCFLLKDERNAK